MKKIIMVLLLSVSLFFVTGCNKEETIKTYDDIEFIEKKEPIEEDEEIEEDDFETLEYTYFSKPDISLFITKSTIGNEYGDYYLYFVASKDNKDIWEYKTSSYFIGVTEGEYYIFDANNEEIVYIFETECITALDLNTGKVLWQNKENSDKEINNGIIINDILYAKGPWDKNIYAINKNTGKQQKTIVIPSKDENELFEIIGSYNNNLIVQSNSEDSEYYLLNPKTSEFSKMNLYLNK